jgi:hypothetical protein
MREDLGFLSKIVACILQSYWRLARGGMLAAEACLFDAQNRVGLITSGSDDDWRLPRAMVHKGEALEQALRRFLKDAHGIGIKSRPDFFWLYDEASAKGLWVGLFIIRDWTTASPPLVPGLTFFDLSRLPSGLDAGDAARICQAADGRAPFEVC